MWDPLSGPDYALLALAGLHQVLVLAVVVHLIACRDWPPYLVKNVPLVCVTGVAGFIHLSGVVISFGFWEYSSPSLWSNCFFQGVVVSTGAGLYFAGAVVRVYRNYKVLMLHTVDMLPPTVQILIVQAPMWVAAMFLLIPSVASFDFEANRCKGNARYVLLGAFNYAGLLVIGSVYLLWKMRDARRQMTEYRAMMLSLGSLLLTLAAVNLTAGKIAEDDTLTRRIALLNNMVRGLLLFWPVIFTPLCKYTKRDQRYAERFSAGMRPSITPAMLRASLADQLKVDKLWALFEKIAEERLPPALPRFYKAVMERDKEEGHFQRQAMTMDIMDTYIVDNAVCRVDLTEACRDRILASEVTRYTIFSEAAAEVLEVLQERCEMAFQASPAYEELLRKAEQDEAQMEALDKANLLPKRKGVGFDFDETQTYNSRSDRWTNSTVAARAKTFFLGLGCCYWTRATTNRGVTRGGGGGGAKGHRRRKRRHPPPHRDAAVRSKGWAGGRAALAATKNPSSSRHGTAARAIVGYRSEIASQHTAGDVGSPLEWLAEEVKDVEMGDASSEEAANTGALSSLSANATSRHENGSRLFGRTLNRTLTSSPPSTERGLTATSPPLPPPPAPAASSSGLNSPTTSLSPAAAGGAAAAAAAVAGQLPPKAPTATTSARPPRAQQKQRRPPPTPWAPWRRQPSEPSIAPVSSSPAETAGMMNMEEGNAGAVAGAVATAGIRGGGPCIAARAIPSLNLLESLVMLMPPSPSTPPEEDCDSGPGPSGKRNPSAAARGLKAGGAGARVGDGTTVVGPDGGSVPGQQSRVGFVPVAPWRNWVNGTFVLEDEEDEEEKKEGELGDGKSGVETCAQFAAKSGFIPFRGYQPNDAWLAVAMQKEEKQKREEAERARLAGHPPLGRAAPLKEMTQEEESVASRTKRTTAKTVARHHTLVQQSSDAGSPGERKVPGDGDTSPRSPSVTSASPQQPPGPGLLPGRAFCREREVSPPPSRPSPLPLSLSSSSSRSFMPPASPANSTSLGGAECSSSHSPAAPSQRSWLKGCTSPTASQLSGSPLKGCFSPVAESQLSTYSEEEEEEEEDLDIYVDVEIARPCEEEGPAPFSGSPSPGKELLGCSIRAAEEKIVTEEQIAAGERSGAEEGSPSPSTSASPPSPQPVVAQRRCVAEVGSEPPGAVAGWVATGTGTGSRADSGSRDQAAGEKRGPPVSPAEIPLPPSPPHPPPGRSPTLPPLPDGDSTHAVDETPERLRSPVTTPPFAERPERARKAPRIVARKTGQTKRPRPSRMASAGAAPPSAAVSSSLEMKRPARAQPARARAWFEPPHAPAVAAAAPQHQQQARAVIPSAPPFAAAPWPSALGTLTQFAAGTRISPTPSAMLLSPSPKTPPPQAPPPPLSLITVGAPPCHLLFTPPSPAGGSSSASPTSSLRTSPVPRPPLLPPAVVLSGRDLPPSDPAAASLLAWSLSDSTLSGCSRPGTGGGGGGTSSIPVSVCSEGASPLVGMRFVSKDGGGCGGGSSSSRSRPKSWSNHGGGVPLIGVRGSPPLGHPPSVPVALCGVGRPAASAEEEEGAAAGAGRVAAAVAGGGTASVVDESSCEGGVGGRRGKRPRRYFFP